MWWIAMQQRGQRSFSIYWIQKMSWIVYQRFYIQDLFLIPEVRLDQVSLFLLKLFHMSNHQTISERMVLVNIRWLILVKTAVSFVLVLCDQLDDSNSSERQKIVDLRKISPGLHLALAEWSLNPGKSSTANWVPQRRCKKMLRDH